MPDDDIMQSSSAPTIYMRRAPEGGGVSEVATRAADISADQMMSMGGGPIQSDGKPLVDPRISNKHFSPC